jgi:hypothetical protein
MLVLQGFMRYVFNLSASCHIIDGSEELHSSIVCQLIIYKGVGNLL